MGRQVVRYVDSQLKFDSKLVNIVKHHKHLFDKGHKLFEDAGTRMETWEYIAKVLGKPEAYCMSRWEYIVNRFYDEIIWMIKYNTASLWLLFPQVEFLGEFIDLQDVTDSFCNEFDIAFGL